MTIPEVCSKFTPDFIVPAVNAFTSKIHINSFEYQFDLFLSFLNLSFYFKLMSCFNLTNITKVKSDSILSKLPQVTDVPITSCMQKLEETDNEYNESFYSGSYLL